MRSVHVYTSPCDLPFPCPNIASSAANAQIQRRGRPGRRRGGGRLSGPGAGLQLQLHVAMPWQEQELPVINSPKASGYGRKPFSTHRHLESLPWPFFFLHFPGSANFTASHRLRRAGSVDAAGCGAAAIHPPALGWGRWRGGPRRKHRDDVSSWRLLEDERGLQGKRGSFSPLCLFTGSRCKISWFISWGKEQRGWSGSQEGDAGVGKALGGLGAALSKARG